MYQVVVYNTFNEDIISIDYFSSETEAKSFHKNMVAKYETDGFCAVGLSFIRGI